MQLTTMEVSNAGSIKTDEDVVVEIYLIRHGESTANVHPSIGEFHLCQSLFILRDSMCFDPLKWRRSTGWPYSNY
jgi:hypothetical protein